MRGKFWWKSLMSGWAWLTTVLTLVGTIFLLAALVAGVVVSIAVFQLPTWAAASFLSLGFLVVFGEGAFQVWQEENREAQKAQKQIEDYHRSDFEISLDFGYGEYDSYVSVRVSNNGPTSDFEAQVLGVRGCREPPRNLPFSVAWATVAADKRCSITRGHTERLSLAKIRGTEKAAEDPEGLRIGGGIDFFQPALGQETAYLSKEGESIYKARVIVHLRVSSIDPEGSVDWEIPMWYEKVKNKVRGRAGPPSRVRE